MPNDKELPARTHSHGSLFGRRKGHKLRAHQSELFETLLPRLSLDLARPADHYKDIVVHAGANTLRLEIGFGGGEHLIAEARANPDTLFFGVEPYVNGMAKILARIEEHGVTNIRLFAGDAAELLAWMPDSSLSRIDLIHPDPWPKKRHWKRRFVQDATIVAMARILRPGGEFRFVCDIESYCAWTLMHMQRANDFRWTAERANDWRAPWPGYTMTRYGRKAEREGRRTAYFIFEKS